MTGPDRLRFPTTRPRKRSATGKVAAFTMIEMMVVIVIIGLLSAMAVPNFLRADAEAKLEGDAQRVLLNFRIAKQAASKTNLRHWIKIVPPRGIEIWRARTSADLTFGGGNDEMIFRDTLNIKTQFGVSSALKTASGVPGFDDPSTASDYNGLASSDSTYEDCLDGKPYPDTTKVSSYGWKGNTKNSASYVIQSCGTSIADMTEGISYLTSTGSDNKMYAIAYDRSVIQLRFFRYTKGATPSWEEL